MVIVGAGEAGARAAISLRQNGWDGPITLIGAEAYPPYERPPLSKSLLTEYKEPIIPSILNRGEIEDYAIALCCGSPAAKIDRFCHRVMLDNGRELEYERLLIATGATSRRLNIPGATLENVLYLRSFDEAVTLRSSLRRGRKLVVIGGGFIGLEIAASARSREVDVTVLECAPRLLTRGVPATIANAIAARHRSEDVELRFSVTVREIICEGERYRILLSEEGEARAIDCDCIVAGVGAVPDTGLAAGSGLGVENGIRVNSQFLTSDPDIFAVGDCCSFPHLLYQGRRIRLESWRSAQDQGTFVASNMLGASEDYRAVPWFWSDQYELTVQVAGLCDEGDETVVRDLGNAQVHFHLGANGRLVAASALGTNSAIAKEIRLSEMLISQSAVPDRTMLASPEVRLRSLLKSSETRVANQECVL